MQMRLPYQISFIAPWFVVVTRPVGDWEWWPGWHSVSTTTLTTTTAAAVAVAVAVIIGRLHTGDTVTRVIFASSCI